MVTSTVNSDVRRMLGRGPFPEMSNDACTWSHRTSASAYEAWSGKSSPGNMRRRPRWVAPSIRTSLRSVAGRAPFLETSGGAWWWPRQASAAAYIEWSVESFPRGNWATRGGGRVRCQRRCTQGGRTRYSPGNTQRPTPSVAPTIRACVRSVVDRDSLLGISNDAMRWSS